MGVPFSGLTVNGRDHQLVVLSEHETSRRVPLLVSPVHIDGTDG